jgi:hypothetical protein
MNYIDPTTGKPVEPGTGDDKSTATPTATTTKTPATDDKTVTLSEADYKKLVGQRDRANNAKGDLDETVLTLAEERNLRIKKDMITEYIEKNKTTYPDIDQEDLMGADSPEDFEELAKARQRRYEDIVQKKLLDVQKADAPVLSPTEREAELKKLKSNPDGGSFGRMLELKQSA